MSRLVVLGSVNADHVLRVTDFPRPGETVTGHGYQVIPGGKGANQAVAAARLNGDTGFIARVGSDSFGTDIIQSFQQDGMDTTHVSQDPQLPTGIAIIYVSDQGENSIGISAEANGALTPDVVMQAGNAIRAADTLLMQLETPLDSLIQAARLARESGTHVVLNPAPARELPSELLLLVDVITPNETEAEVLTGIKVTDEDSAQRAAKALHDMGIGSVLITLGAKGVWVSTPDLNGLVPGFRVEAVDTTAAGDTFNGALMVGLQEGKDLASAIRFAHAAAALSVTRHGAQTSIPSRAEVDSFLTSN